jgi:uncharacterized membrane protein YfcA
MGIALLMLVGGVGVGIFGSLLGLGGGLLIVPLLTLGFGLPLRESIGVSLVCVIVTSGASAGVFLERRVANLRLGMVLELFTAMGALLGGLIAFLLDERLLAGLFAALMTYVAITMARPRRPEASASADSMDASAAEASDGTAPAAEPKPAAAPEPRAGPPAAEPEDGFVARLSGADYRIRNLVPGFGGSIVAGVASALLGIGGGLVKVPVMHLLMGVPLRVATATSNLMIGITASTSAWIYLIRGGIDPYATGPTAIGVFVGATLGSRLAHRVDVRALRLLFTVVLLYTAFEMARRALGLS